jgi:hypothetical protein
MPTMSLTEMLISGVMFQGDGTGPTPMNKTRTQNQRSAWNSLYLISGWMSMPKLSPSPLRAIAYCRSRSQWRGPAPRDHFQRPARYRKTSGHAPRRASPGYATRAGQCVQAQANSEGNPPRSDGLIWTARASNSCQPMACSLPKSAHTR